MLAKEKRQEISPGLKGLSEPSLGTGALNDVGGTQATDLMLSVLGVKNCPQSQKDLFQHRCDSSSH